MQLDAAQLTRLISELRPAAPAPEIFIHDTLGSTNDEVARLLAANQNPAAAKPPLASPSALQPFSPSAFFSARLLVADSPAPLVVIARRQTKGRGRFGRPWLSEPNGNLYISFGFRPRVAPARLQTFTLWMGVVLCDFLAAHMRAASHAPSIKWPNDIFFGARKVAGLLTEARAADGNIDTLVFGLGLNLKPPAAGWPPELAATATSLAEQSDGEIADADANAFVAALIIRVLDAHTQLLENPDATAAALAALWQKYDHLRGKTITALSGNGTERITGVADGIDNEGSLILKMPDARVEKIRAGEVTIEK